MGCLQGGGGVAGSVPAAGERVPDGGGVPVVLCRQGTPGA